MTAFAPPNPSWASDLFGGPQNLFQAYYEDQPQAGYQRALRDQGVNAFGGSARESFYRDAFSRAYQQYLGEAPYRPELSWTQAIGEYLPQIEQGFQGQDPRQRGERYGYGTGRVRYIL